MRYTTCADCDKKVPLNDTFRYQERDYCTECLRIREERNELFDRDMMENIDHTVCANCGADNGATEYDRLAGLPVCGNCHRFYTNRPFPTWVKAFVLSIFLVGAAGISYNFNYIQAFIEMRRASGNLQKGDIESAAQEATEAARRLPHIQSLQNLSAFYRAMDHLMNERPGKAVIILDGLVRRNPAEKTYQKYLLHAQAGQAFNNRKYANFYRYNKSLLELTPDDAMTLLGVASGAACLYAATGKNHYRREATMLIRKGIELIKPEEKERAMQYIERIEYRLKTRKIITQKEYLKLKANQEGSI